MIERICKDTGVIVVAGAAMLIVAYLSGAGSDVLAWMLAMFLVVMAFLILKVLKADGPYDDALNQESVSEELSYEMDLLVEQIENSAKDMLGHVHKELSQIRSLVSDAIEVLQKSFNDLNLETKEQNRMVQEVMEKLKAAQASRGNVNDLLDGRLSQFSESTQRIDKSITDAVRSLQFEDIVRQLTVSSEKHLSYLERVLGTVDEGIRGLNSQHINVPEYIVGLHELKAQIDKLEEERKAEAQRSVSQKTMQQGEVELF
jgi:methyl-accepting chemotaxis protein